MPEREEVQEQSALSGLHSESPTLTFTALRTQVVPVVIVDPEVLLQHVLSCE